jgi:histidine ammonia-lyase
MGWSAARKLRSAVANLTRILAVELVAAARATDMRTQSCHLAPAPATAAVIRALRAAGVPGPDADRFLSPELAAAEEFVRSGALVRAAESVTGPLA